MTTYTVEIFGTDPCSLKDTYHSTDVQSSSMFHAAWKVLRAIGTKLTDLDAINQTSWYAEYTPCVVDRDGGVELVIVS